MICEPGEPGSATCHITVSPSHYTADEIPADSFKVREGHSQ